MLTEREGKSWKDLREVRPLKSHNKGSKGKNKGTGLYQTRKILHSKKPHQQNKRQPTEWEEVFANNNSDRG